MPENTLTYLSRHGEADQGHMEDLKRLINRYVTKPQDIENIIYVSNTEFEMYGQIIMSTVQNDMALSA